MKYGRKKEPKGSLADSYVRATLQPNEALKTFKGNKLRRKKEREKETKLICTPGVHLNSNQKIVFGLCVCVFTLHLILVRLFVFTKKKLCSK